jgi:thioredoxin reductase (NADPH)
VLGHEGVPPLELLARGRAEAEGYGVHIVTGSATNASGVLDDFTIEVDGGALHLKARRIVLATGLVDELPAVPGVEAAWGHSVLHCPFCHGWEVRDQRIAVLGRNENSFHQVLLFRQLSDDVTFFIHDAPDPTDEQWEQLAALGVDVVTPRVERLVVEGTQVRAVEIEGGRSFEMDAVVVAPRFIARTTLYEALGGNRTTTPFFEHIPADPRGTTAVPGVWAAGNASEIMTMVAASAASGVMVGSAVHGDLAAADLAQAVRVRRKPFSATMEAENSKAILGDRRHGM